MYINIKTLKRRVINEDFIRELRSVKISIGVVYEDGLGVVTSNILGVDVIRTL